ncbi:MAG: hypothetical protein ACKVW3_10620 [Phycisphaerales bacterium]
MKMLRITLCVAVAVSTVLTVNAQPTCTPLSPAIELGPVANTGSTPAVLASHVLTVNSAWRAARLYFKSGEVLPDGSFLRITSPDDGAVQIINSAEIGEWRYSSAYFNVATSHQLLLELVCAPHTAENYVAIIEACPAAPRSLESCHLCTPQPPMSNVKWAARIIDRNDI